MFVLQRQGTGSDWAFVADRGVIEATGRSYTDKLQCARTFTTREAAKRHATGEDFVRAVLDVLPSPDDSAK